MPRPLIERATNHLPRRYNEDPNDVFLLIKGFVSDRDICQEPLIVWPGCKSQETWNGLCRLARNEVNRHLDLKTAILFSQPRVTANLSQEMPRVISDLRHGMQLRWRTQRSPQRDRQLPQWELFPVWTGCQLFAAAGRGQGSSKKPTSPSFFYWKFQLWCATWRCGVAKPTAACHAHNVCSVPPWSIAGTLPKKKSNTWQPDSQWCCRTRQLLFKGVGNCLLEDCMTAVFQTSAWFPMML